MSQRAFIPLIHSKSGSLSFLFFSFRGHNVYRKMSVAKVVKTHNRSASCQKIHFLTRGYSVFVTLTPEADIRFGQGHFVILSHTPIPVNFNDKKSKHLPRQNKLYDETMKWILYEKAKIQPTSLGHGEKKVGSFSEISLQTKTKYL